jgi:hypothetical protein
MAYSTPVSRAPASSSRRRWRDSGLTRLMPPAAAGMRKYQQLWSRRFYPRSPTRESFWSGFRLSGRLVSSGSSQFSRLPGQPLPSLRGRRRRGDAAAPGPGGTNRRHHFRHVVPAAYVERKFRAEAGASAGNLPYLHLADPFASIVRVGADRERELVRRVGECAVHRNSAALRSRTFAILKSSHWWRRLELSSHCIVTLSCEYSDTKPRETPT